jgi:hypothetical protein
MVGYDDEVDLAIAKSTDLQVHEDASGDSERLEVSLEASKELLLAGHFNVFAEEDLDRVVFAHPVPRERDDCEPA